MANITFNTGVNPVREECWALTMGRGILPTVLHVEDDPNDVLLLKIAFRRAKLPVVLQDVGDGQAAVQYLSGSGIYADRLRFPFPRLVLSDLNMPRLDGFELLAWVRVQPGMRGLQMIVLSSSDQPGDVARAKALGSDRYLVKAIGYEEVISVVQNYLGTDRNSGSAAFEQRAEQKPRNRRQVGY